MGERWRALRGAPGLVEYADALTRLNRAMSRASMTVMHLLSDLDTLTAEADRPEARGFTDRAAVTGLAGLLSHELARVAAPSKSLCSRVLRRSWSPPGWHRIPGNGESGIRAATST
ncbi:hypothetical protein GCM10027161_79760 [Microbispora hainanensis]